MELWLIILIFVLFILSFKYIFIFFSIIFIYIWQLISKKSAGKYLYNLQLKLEKDLKKYIKDTNKKIKQNYKKGKETYKLYVKLVKYERQLEQTKKNKKFFKKWVN